MSYRPNKPFGRRKTDLSSSARESSHWQKIRRDVDEDPTGLIRRYLRLSEKIIGAENEVKLDSPAAAPAEGERRLGGSNVHELPELPQRRRQKDRAA